MIAAWQQYISCDESLFVYLFLETMTPIPNGFNLERLVVLVRHGARTTLSQAKVLQPQEWIMKNLINMVSIT